MKEHTKLLLILKHSYFQQGYLCSALTLSYAHRFRNLMQILNPALFLKPWTKQFSVKLCFLSFQIWTLIFLCPITPCLCCHILYRCSTVSFKVHFTGWYSGRAVLSDDSLSQCEGLSISFAPAVWSNGCSVGEQLDSASTPVTICLG